MQASPRRIAEIFPVSFKIASTTLEKRDQKRFPQRQLSGWIRTTWKVGLPAVACRAKVGTPSIANLKPQCAWKSIRQWLEAMQLIAAA
jgi:hypothetical protein